MSGETLPIETPLGGNVSFELPPWEEQYQNSSHDDEDGMEDDDELGLPPSKSEQMRKQMQYEEQMRQELIQRAKKLHQYATDTQSAEHLHDKPLRPRAHGIVRNESGDSLRLSSEWGDEYYAGKGAIGRVGPDVMTSFRSNGSGRSSSSGKRVTRSDLSAGSRRSRSGSHSGREYRYGNGGVPRHRDETGIRQRHDSNEEGRTTEEEFERQKRTQQYFDMRNAQLTLLSARGAGRVESTPQQYNNDGEVKVRDSAEQLFEYERPMAARRRSSGVGAGSDLPVPRHLSGSELESPYTSLSDSHVAGAFTTRRRYRSDDLEDRDNEAFRLAMSAMRMYEEERGPNLQVTEETRQAALTKMMEVYAREIERSRSNDSGPYSRGTISDTRRLHHDVGVPPPLRRTVSDDRPQSFYGSPLQVFRRDDFAPGSRRQRRPVSSKYSQGESRGTSRQDTYGPTLPARQKTSENTHEYRDLSDLTSSAFQAFQMNSLGPRDAPKLPIEENESLEDSTNNQQAEDHIRPTSVQFQRESTSTTHVQLKSDTSGDRSGAARATYSSIESSDVANLVSRPNSMYGIVDSDTFSDMDFTDLPHLMRKDDVDVGARSSFTDLQHWVEENSSQTHDAENGGVEYVPEPRLSDLLSPLHLEGVQHVDDDDSESQSSNSSSQIDWRTGERRPARGTNSESSFIRTYSITHQSETESITDLTSSLYVNSGLSDKPQRRYAKPPSLSELLSEYCDSERSSLPSYLEFGGSQPELEPEYLEAIANANKQNSVHGKREHVRRRSSIPSELEAMTSRELYL